MSVAAEVMLALRARAARGAYFGERVSMSEHGLQAAHFARVQGAPDNLVIAALLHDVGHLLEAVPDDIEDWVSDAHHEESGARWLAQRLPPTWPNRCDCTSRPSATFAPWIRVTSRSSVRPRFTP